MLGIFHCSLPNIWNKPFILHLGASVDTGHGSQEPCWLTLNNPYPINDPQYLHKHLHKADIFIQGFNVLHFFFSERKVKDLK
jgi:hypothetical protein